MNNIYFYDKMFEFLSDDEIKNIDTNNNNDYKKDGLDPTINGPSSTNRANENTIVLL